MTFTLRLCSYVVAAVMSKPVCWKFDKIIVGIDKIITTAISRMWLRTLTIGMVHDCSRDEYQMKVWWKIYELQKVIPMVKFSCLGKSKVSSITHANVRNYIIKHYI